MPHVSLGCGHSFCAPCIRQWFKTKLAARLSRISYLQRRIGDTYNCRVPPNNEAHLAYLLAVLTHYQTHDVQRILDYPCPTCRASTTVPPVESLSMKTLIREVEGAIGGHSVDDRANEDGVTTLGYFNSLFSRIDLVMNTPALPRSRRFS